MISCIVNNEGEMLEILQLYREPKDGEFKVNLGNYYDVLNEERYCKARYDFKLKTWVGVGEQRPLIIIKPTETELLKQRLEATEAVLLEILAERM